MYHKKAAGGFTIVEVLITIAIIGVVAAVIIPALLKNTNNTEYKSAWKKSYSDLAQAAKLILADDSTAFTGTCSNTQLRDLFAGKLKIIQSCSDGQSIGNCWPSSYKNYNGTASSILGDGSGLVLPTGEMLMFSSSKIYIDTNGLKSPNKWGKDLFGASVSSAGTSPDNGDCTETGTGVGCGYQYLYDIAASGTGYTNCGAKPGFACWNSTTHVLSWTDADGKCVSTDTCLAVASYNPYMYYCCGPIGSGTNAVCDGTRVAISLLNGASGYCPTSGGFVKYMQ